MTEKNEISEIKLFGKWSFKDIKVEGPGLANYICLKPVFSLHTGGRHEYQKFKKSEVSISLCGLVRTLVRRPRLTR